MFNKIIWIIAYLLLAVQGANAYDPAAEVDANFESTYSTSLVDQKVHQTTLSEVQESNSDSNYKKIYEENRAGKVIKETQYFQSVTMPSCEGPEDYVCPPLIDNFAKEGLRTRLNEFDLTTGRASCSVLPALDFGVPLTKDSESRILHTQTFVNQACVVKYSVGKNQSTSDDIKKLKKENSLFLEELKQQQFKNTTDYTNGQDEFLDLADILDGLVSFNVDKFDLEATLLSQDLKTRTGYTVLPNDSVVENMTQSVKGLWDIIKGDGWDSDRFYKDQKVQARIRDASAAVANSSYFMLLQFWLHSQNLILDISLVLAFILVSYNIFATWALPSATAKMMKLEYQRENHAQRGIAGVLMLIMLFAGDVEKLNIQYENSDGIIESELIVQQSNMQALIQLLYSETNWMADKFTEVGIKAYLSSINGSAGLFDSAQIDALASEEIILKKQQIQLAKIDTDMCVANYDTQLILSRLKSYRTSSLDKRDYDFYDYKSKGWVLDSSPEISPLRANPYPKSEREAQAMMYISSTQGNISPYNSASADVDAGVVKRDAYNKFRTPNYSALSLSGCYQNKKKMIETDSRIREIQEQFQSMGSASQKQAKLEYLKIVNEIIWNAYGKLGYLSISFLPATAMMVDQIGIVGDLDKIEKAIDDAVESGGEDAITELTTDTLKSISEDMPYLAMMGGYQLAKIIHPIKDKIIDDSLRMAGNATAMVSFGAGRVAVDGIRVMRKIRNKLKIGNEEIDVLDLQIAAIVIKSIFKSLIYATLIVGALMLFILLFIEKLFAFISSLFLIMYAFSNNQAERLQAAAAKIFIVGFKTVLIVICIIMGMYAFVLVNTFEMIFVESFFKTMDTIENASWAIQMEDFSMSNIMSLVEIFFSKYIFYGVAKFSFMFLKLILAFNIMFKMPGYVIELIYERMNSVADGIGETMQSVSEKTTMKI
ncbi:MAG: hypothetical protein M0R77_19470 [Gammaproteobacteria bacterium]|nr:hypothetical protein [Gammaproteobacteria bacterium]